MSALLDIRRFGGQQAVLCRQPSLKARTAQFSYVRRKRCCVAAAQEGRSSGDDEGLTPPASPLLRIQAAMEVAVSSEDYAAAARCRDQLTELRMQDPEEQQAAAIEELRKQLQVAVDAEDYQAAIVFRNRLLSLLGDQLLQELPPELAGPRSGCPPTTSETVTANGVRVSACSAYVMSAGSQHLFSYTITVSNESKVPVQLKNTSWVITDGKGHTQDGRSTGMGGGQPVLAPGQHIQYQSTCPLCTPVGIMEGSLELCSQVEGGEGAWGQPFMASIGRFGLNGLRMTARERKLLQELQRELETGGGNGGKGESP